MKGCCKIMSYCLLIFVIGPAIMTVVDNLEFNCRKNSLIYYYGYVDDKKCKQLENMYVDMILNKLANFLDCLINLCVTIGVCLEDALVWIYANVFGLFYHKEETIVEKISEIFHRIWSKKETKICKIITPYLKFANRGLNCLTAFQPTCLTAVLTKLFVLVMNPIPPLICALIYLTYEFLFEPVRRCLCRGILKNKK